MRLLACLSLLLLLSLPVPSARAVEGPHAGGRVVVSGKLADDVYATGQSVHISAQAAGDVVAAGGTVTLTGETAGNAIVAGGSVEVGRRVRQDLLAAGGNVEIGGHMDDDVRAAGGTVTVTATVGGDLVAAGGDLSLAAGASVAGRTWLAGGSVEVAGTVGRELRVRAGDVRITGVVRGDADVAADAVAIGPGARIEGRLVYASPQEATIDPQARIAGGVERRPLPPGALGPGIGWGDTAGVAFGVVAALIAAFVMATLLRFAWPGFSLQTAATLASHPWKSLALGFALLVCIPAAAALLFSIVIGMPLALGLLLLYPIALVLALLIVAVLLAEVLQRWFFGRRDVPVGWRVLILWASVLLLALVSLIPGLGQLIGLASLMLGLGALGLHLAGRYAAGGGAPPSV